MTHVDTAVDLICAAREQHSRDIPGHSSTGTSKMRAKRFFLLDVVGLASLLHPTRTSASTARVDPAEVGMGAVQAIREPNCLSLGNDVGAKLVEVLESNGKAIGERYSR